MIRNFFKFIWNLLKGDDSGKISIPAPTPAPIELPAKGTESVFDIKKIAIIVGHGNGDSGAGGWNGVEEFAYNSQVAKIIEASDIGKQKQIFWRGSSGIVGVAAKAMAYGPDMTIELHLNAYNGVANGCEVLCLNGDPKSGALGRSFAKSFTDKFGRKLRRELGINWINSGDRGGTSLKAVSAAKYSILVEPFFIDTPSEWIDPKVYAEFIVNWLREI